MYHGGTISRDAASKYIHVKNQVSLGAGETTMVKLKFEQWLWEQTQAAAKHYDSDNGIFQAKRFTDS